MLKTLIKHLLNILPLVVQIITVSTLALILPISYAETTQNTYLETDLEDRSNILLPIYNNEPVSMVSNLATRDRMPPIVAFADSSCDGKLSIVKYSSPAVTRDGALQFAYIGQCISNGPIHNIILRNFYNSLYVAYIDKDNQIKLMQRRFGYRNWNDYPYSDQLLNKNPNYMDMLIDNNSNPVITYTNNPSGKNYQYISVLRYNGTGYNTFAIGDKVVTRGLIHTSLDSNNNLYIAYLDWNFCPGIIKLLAGSNNWSYLNSNFAKLFRHWLINYPDAFDMVIKQRKNIKDGGDMLYLLMARDSNIPGINNMAVYTYDIAVRNPELENYLNINIHSRLNDSVDGIIRPHLHVNGNGDIFLSYINNHRTCVNTHSDPFCIEKFSSRVARFTNNNEINYFSQDIANKDASNGFIEVNQTSNPLYYFDFLGYQLVATVNGYKMFPLSLIPRQNKEMEKNEKKL